MPIIDNQHRVQIPSFFRDLFQDKSEIAFCYDSNRIYLINANKPLDNHKIIAIRKLDSHWRFVISKEVLLALGAENWDDIFIMYKQNEILYLEKKV